MIAESFLTVMNVAQGATKLYDWFTGVSIGDKLSHALTELERTKQQVERLSDHVLYAPNMQQALSMGRSKYLEDGREIVRLLGPLASSTGDLLSTAIVSSPQKLKKAFEKDPWEVLIDIRPVERAKAPLNPDLAPIVFSDGGQAYVGWQTKGALPQLLNCEFKEDVGIWIPRSSTATVRSADDQPKGTRAARSSTPSAKAPVAAAPSALQTQPPVVPTSSVASSGSGGDSVVDSVAGLGAVIGLITSLIFAENDLPWYGKALAGAAIGGIGGAIVGSIIDKWREMWS